jgi:PPOX class probable F420-dependent enzyme
MMRLPCSGKAFPSQENSGMIGRFEIFIWQPKKGAFMAKTLGKISAEVEKRLNEETVTWLTTVRPDGTPLPTPVWFLWEGETVLIYTIPNSVKLRNLAANPHAALNLNSDQWGGEVVVLTGEIRRVDGEPPVTQNRAYLEKYRAQISDIQMTPESFSSAYSVALRFTPSHVRA